MSPIFHRLPFFTIQTSIRNNVQSGWRKNEHTEKRQSESEHPHKRYGCRRKTVGVGGVSLLCSTGIERHATSEHAERMSVKIQPLEVAGPALKAIAEPRSAHRNDERNHIFKRGIDNKIVSAVKNADNDACDTRSPIYGHRNAKTF